MQRLHVAVIGSGISGLACAWALSQRHQVTLIEADGRIGGHAHTVDVDAGKAASVAVDTGFIVSNPRTYPNFTALMDYLDVPMIETEMSFSVSMEDGGYEYSGDNAFTLMGRRAMWASPCHWRMMADLWRFYRTAETQADRTAPYVTLGQHLEEQGFGEAFIRRHILPMAGAIWSASPDEIAAYPFRAFTKFFSNHGLFNLGKRPPWRTIKGGSREYVRRVVEDSRFTVRLASPVARVLRRKGAVDVQFVSGASESFDHAVIATHGDQALRLLGTPTSEEIALLSPFKTSLNRVILHRDGSLMPKTRRFWSAWNYQGAGEGRESKLAVTYWMNALQELDSPAQHFVSLNPLREPAPESRDGEFWYRHPLFNAATLEAQKELWSLQGRGRLWFAGAWFGAGFHEDGLQAGLAVAEHLGGVSRPWSVPEPSSRIHLGPLQPVETVPLAEAAE